MGVTLACARQRAKVFCLVTQIRRMRAVGLVKGIKIIFRWIPPELSVADFDTRNFGTVRSSHQVRQRQCANRNILSKTRLALVCGASLMDITRKRVIFP